MYNNINNSILINIINYVKALAHGVSQGATARLLSGSFKDGFIGGFSGSYIGSYLPKTNHDITNAMIDITASGTITKLTGGRFQDGARSGAFVYLFNHMGHKNNQLNSIEQQKASNLHMTLSERGGVQQIGSFPLKTMTQKVFQSIGLEVYDRLFNQTLHDKLNQDYQYLNNFYLEHKSDDYILECTRCHKN